MKKLVAALTSLVFIVATTAAMAQPVPEVGVDPKPATASPEKLKRIDFTEGDEITGTWKTGAGEVVIGEKRHKGDSLIKVKANFIEELMKSADEI